MTPQLAVGLCLLLLWSILILVVWGFLSLRARLELIQGMLSKQRIQAILPPIGGRSVPSPAELQAARNRIDPQGTAHPGDCGLHQ